MKFQNFFNRGIVNKDLDSRLIEGNTLIDAENFFVNSTDGQNMGVGKNALGNALKTAYNIVGGKTIGVGKNPSENKVYNFVKGTNYDYIIEYDTQTFASQIVLQSSTGTRLNFISGKRITNVDVITDSEQNGNLLLFSGASYPIRIINIERAKLWGIDGFDADELLLIKAPPKYAPLVVPKNIDGEENNYLLDKFVTFFYRYKYKDKYYSVFSPPEQYTFTPSRFELDFNTFENLGMQNIYNACDIQFNTGSREVEAIDLLFRLSNSTTVYKIDQFVKEDEGWADNVTQTIEFSNSKIYSVLAESEYYRSYDNVPEEAYAQTYIGGRALFGNYKENKNLIDKDNNKVVIDYSVAFISNVFTQKNITVTKQSLASTLQTFTNVDGKISLAFSGASLNKGAAIYIAFNLKSKYNPDTGFIGEFISSYNYIIPQNYTSIRALILDTANGFKTNLEGYFSTYLKNTALQIPLSGSIVSGDYIGFKVTDTSVNTMTIDLPYVKYTIVSGGTTYEYEYFKDISTVVNVDSIGSKTSLKSYRSYEWAMIYKDAYGRKTTALTSQNNTFFINVENSVNQNIAQITIPSTQKPPTWAKTYQFVVKEPRKNYEEIYASIFYKDGIYRWIKLDGSNKNKINEGDTLLVKKGVENITTAPIKVKVIELKNQPENFITANVDVGGTEIKEQSGYYMKIKPNGFSIDYANNEFIYLEMNTATKTNRPFSYLGGNAFSKPSTVTIGNFDNVPISQGSVLSINLHSDYHRDSEQNNYNNIFTANANYTSIKDYYDSELAGISFIGTSGAVFNKSIVRGNLNVDGVFTLNDTVTGQYFLKIEGTASGNGTTRRGFLDANLTLRNISGFYIFETLGEETNETPYYETPNIYNVIDGEHEMEVHTLDKAFNCYVQGNGGESCQIKSNFNEKRMVIDYCPTGISEDEYRENNRFADITYSEIYNSSTNVNKLNEFNLFLANFKDDIDKSYGAIIKLVAQDINLEVYQEDKDSTIPYGKDFLFNADGSSNLISAPEVLGTQDTYKVDFGISTHTDSYDDYEADCYHTDVKRGVVIKKAQNGLFAISSQGMNNYFKKLFRDNTITYINGKYDQYHDVYILNIQYNVSEYVTWVYSNRDDGWLGRITFNPEDMCRLNGKFLSFKNGEIYEHNQSNGRNTFYGIESPSKFEINFSQSPSERKTYKTLETESTHAWDIILETDIDKGFIAQSDFKKEEGVFKSNTKLSNDIVDMSLLSVQGIGSCTISDLVLNFSFPLDNVISVGDIILNINGLVVGTIISKTSNSLTLNTVNNIVSGDYVMCSKKQSANVDGLLGYRMNVKGTITSNVKTEIFAINTEVVKSFN